MPGIERIAHPGIVVPAWQGLDMPKLRRGYVGPAWGSHSSHLIDPERNIRPRYTRQRQLIEQTESCVYFIECGEYIKIGTTIQGAERRLASMQLPPNARLVAVIPGPGYDAEHELHVRFASDRVGGEWFERSPELDALIQAFAV